MTTRSLSALIAEDEPLGRKAIRDIVSKWPDVAIIAEVEDGLAAAEAIAEHRPDLVFMDIGMPGASGMDVVLNMPEATRPAVVFTTAHDEYALEALSEGAIDYVVKPFSADRLRRAVDKALAWVHRQPIAGTEPKYLEWILGRVGKRMIPTRVEDLVLLRGSGNYVEFEAGGETCLVRDRISRMEEALDPSQFCRIHRSVIIRLAAIRAIESDPGGTLLVTMMDGSSHRVGRTYREGLEERFRS